MRRLATLCSAQLLVQEKLCSLLPPFVLKARCLEGKLELELPPDAQVHCMELA